MALNVQCQVPPDQRRTGRADSWLLLAIVGATRRLPYTLGGTIYLA